MKLYYIGQIVLHMIVIAGIWLGWQGQSWTLKAIATILDINIILLYLENIGKEIKK